ncbi:MAG: hypothetical protein JSU81_09115 [Candidatus Coatesbacteria bacterium]|nr:MAG: hypothetical protein JSU81_09115 [Candidatus Coatesbacteria bacterium]
MKFAVALAAAAAAAAGPAWADGPGLVAAEVGCGYLGGLGAGIVGIPVGNFWSTEKFAGGGLYGFIFAYPAGVGLGVYGAGEIWGDDSANDWASVGAALGASYASAIVGYAVGEFDGLVIGMLAAPAASTAAYNLTKMATEKDDGGGAAIYVSYAVFF